MPDLSPTETLTAAARWSRPFRIVLPDGASYHGAEFPNGRVAVDLEHSFRVALSLDGLLSDCPPGTAVIRPDEQPGEVTE